MFCIATAVRWVLWLCLATFIKNDNFHLWKLCLSACKKWLPSLTSFLRYCKDIAHLLLWVFWECLIMPINYDSIALQETLIPKLLKSTCRKLWCLSACKENENENDSLLSSFLTYCKGIANLLFWELPECLTTLIKNHSINL